MSSFGACVVVTVEQPCGRSLTVLAYHKIGDPPEGGWETWNYVSEDIFAHHLAVLRDEDCVVVDAGTFLRGLNDPGELPERAVLLTFDDGYLSMRITAAPLLARFGYPAVVFMPSDYVGRHNEFDAGNEPDEPMCSWDDLRWLQSHRVSIQSHSRSHRQFSDLQLSDLHDEVERSKSSLEQGLGTSVEIFAYPYGDAGRDVDSTTRALQSAGYRAAFLYDGGGVRLPADHPYQLSRLAIGPDTELAAELAQVRQGVR